MMPGGSPDYIGFAYAGTVAAGGILGYLRKKSLPSLIAGLGFALLIGIGAWQISQNPPNHYLMLGSSSVLAGIMGVRFSRSGKLMPAGIVCAMSTLMFIRSGITFFGK